MGVETPQFLATAYCCEFEMLRLAAIRRKTYNTPTPPGTSKTADRRIWKQLNTSSTSSSSPSGLPVSSGKISISASYYLSFVVLGLAGASLGPTLPALAEQTNSQLSQISILFTARLLGYLLGSLVGGPIFDRVRGNPVMAVALLIMAAALALTPMLPVLWLLAAVLLVLGIGEGTLNVGGNALLVWVHGDRVGPFMNGMHFVFGVGSFLAPVIVAQSILMTDGIRWAYWLLALLMFPVAFWLIRLKSPVRPDSPQERSAGRSNAWLVGLMILFFFLHVGALVCIGGWLFTYTVALNPGSQAMAAYLNSAFWAALTIGRLISIPIAARVKPGSILLFDMIGSLICLGLIVVWAGSSSVLWVGTIGHGAVHGHYLSHFHLPDAGTDESERQGGRLDFRRGLRRWA